MKHSDFEKQPDGEVKQELRICYQCAENGGQQVSRVTSKPLLTPYFVDTKKK